MLGKSLIVMMVLFISCEYSTEPNVNDDGKFIHLIVDDYEYPTNKPHSYTSVSYQTYPTTRVFWYTPNTYKVYFMNRLFEEPIIRYSTYSNSYGEGKQMIYISKEHIGSYLTIIGCISTNVCDTTEFKVY